LLNTPIRIPRPNSSAFSTAQSLLSYGVLSLPRSRQLPSNQPKEHVTPMNIEQLAIRVRAEFREMPGLRLTVRQAERLWGLDPDVCAQVVDVLVSRAILKRHGDTFSLAN
jgi:hypothetical protein